MSYNNNTFDVQFMLQNCLLQKQYVDGFIIFSGANPSLISNSGVVAQLVHNINADVDC